MCGGNTLQYQIPNMQMILKGKLDAYFDKTTTSSSFPYSIPLTISQQGMIAYADHTRKWSDCTPGRTREVSIIDLDVFMKNIYLEIEYLAQFCMSIQPFAQLPKDQKWLLFKHFWPGFFELYRCYQSCIILGYNIDDDRCVCLDGAIINFKCHMTKLDIVTELSEEQVRAFMKPSHDYFKELVINPFKKMKPREFELIYMSMNFMWNIKHIPGVNDSTLAIANQVKNRLDEEFHNYYTHELLMPNYASRLHRMSDIVSALDKLHERRREDSQVSRTFNIFKQDVFLSELI